MNSKTEKIQEFACPGYNVNMTGNNLSEQTELPKDDKPLTFKWVAECLYRHPNTGKYYALVKKNAREKRKYVWRCYETPFKS